MSPVRTEKQFPSRTSIDKFLVWDAKHFHNTRKLLLFVFPREDRKTGVKFSQNATKTPHVNCHMIVHAKDNFRRSIETTLNVSVDFETD